MDRAEFDKFAQEYKSLHGENIAASGESPEYFAEYKMKDLKRIVEAARDVEIEGAFLDFGAGVGTSVPFFRKYFPSAHLTCLDVSEASLEIAAANFGRWQNTSLLTGRRFPSKITALMPLTPVVFSIIFLPRNMFIYCGNCGAS